MEGTTPPVAVATVLACLGFQAQCCLKRAVGAGKRACDAAEVDAERDPGDCLPEYPAVSPGSMDEGEPVLPVLRAGCGGRMRPELFLCFGHPGQDVLALVPRAGAQRALVAVSAVPLRPQLCVSGSL